MTSDEERAEELRKILTDRMAANLRPVEDSIARTVKQTVLVEDKPKRWWQFWR